MPLQNRVTPEGRLEAVTARGTMMGNRGGCFHRDDQSLKPRHWASRQWICCVLSFRDRQRRVFSPGRYTELFFLDEATALAAGHRPCFECRRREANAFAAAWASAHALAAPPSAPTMDLVLHAERRASAPPAPTMSAPLGSLPDGAMVRDDDGPALVRGGLLYRWTHHGYRPGVAVGRQRVVNFITPRSIIDVLRSGYRPQIHPSVVVAQVCSPPNRPISSE